MVLADKTKQLDIFSLLKTPLLDNALLQTRFNHNNIVQFDPLLKSAGSENSGFPHIWIKIPEIEDPRLTVKGTLKRKSMQIPLFLRVERQSSDEQRYRDYITAIINSIEEYECDLEKKGFYHMSLSLEDVDDDLQLDQATVIQAEFTIFLTVRYQV